MESNTKIERDNCMVINKLNQVCSSRRLILLTLFVLLIYNCPHKFIWFINKHGGH